MCSNKSSALLIPIRVDALNLEKEQTVAEAMADFERLPYLNTNQADAYETYDANADTPYISEAVVSKPFQNQNLTLPKGIHLHWALPDALTTAEADGTYPAVPNRWLITRKHASNNQVFQQWLVESDALSVNKPIKPCVIVPIPMAFGEKGQPFRYMGQSMQLEQWLTQANNVQTWKEVWKKPLTATGYGEPAFAAFYPNCFSVFGFQDEAYFGDQAAGFQYEVIGWYSDAEMDFMLRFQQKLHKKTIKIYKQQLDQHFIQHLGEVTWNRLVETAAITPTIAQIQKDVAQWDWPIDNPSKLAMKALAYPRPLAQAIRLEALSQKELLASIHQQLQPIQDAIWKELLTKAWIKPSGEIDASKKEVVLDSKFNDWQASLKQLVFEQAHSKLITKKVAQRQNHAITDEVWKSLRNNKWIQLLDVANGTAIVNPQGQWKSQLHVDRVVSESIRTTLTDPKLPNWISKDKVVNQLPKLVIKQLWNSLMRTALLTKVTGTNSTYAIISLTDEKWENWQKKFPFFKPLRLLLEKLLTDSKRPWMIHQDRFIHRYGEQGKLIWNHLINQPNTGNQWLIPIEKGSSYAWIKKIRERLPLDQAFLTKKECILFKNDFVDHLKIDKAVANHKLQHRILSPHADFSKVTQEEVEARFATHSQLWSELRSKKVIDTIAGQLHVDQLGTALQDWPYAIPLKQFLTEIAAANHQIRKKQLGHQFALWSDGIWEQFFTQKWLIAAEARINQEQFRKPLAQHFVLFQPHISHLLIYKPDPLHPIVNQIDRLTMIQAFEHLANKLWIEMYYQQWLSPVEQNAKAPSAYDQAYYHADQAKGLDGDYSVFVSLLKDFLSGKNLLKKQELLQYFRTEGEAFWKDLLDKNWITAAQDKLGILNGEKPWLTHQELKTDHEEDALQAKQFIEIVYKRFFEQELRHETSWMAGVIISKSDQTWQRVFNNPNHTDLLDTVWQQLLTKSWLLAINDDQSRAVIQPDTMRKPLEGLVKAYEANVLELFELAYVEQTIPSSSIYFGRVNLTLGSAIKNQIIRTPEVDITIANTGTEAFSAKMAHLIDANHQAIIEDQLEAIHFSRILEKKTLDIGAKFKALRHEKEFKAYKGGTIWTIREVSSGNAEKANRAQLSTALPLALAHQLNELNSVQYRYEHALEQIESMQSQLFSDWYKYMLAAYPIEHSRGGYPNIDEVKYFIEQAMLLPLHQLKKATGSLFLHRPPKQMIEASAYAEEGIGADYTNSLAHQVAKKVNELVVALQQWNKALAKQKGNQYDLQQVPSPRFWEPTEPHILLTGDLFPATIRHGKDGSFRADGWLQCILWNAEHSQALPITKANIKTTTVAIQQLVDDLQTAFEHYIGFNTCSEQPWHPILLEWAVGFYAINDPMATHGNPPNLGYDTTFITRNYDLESDSPDFTIKEGGKRPTKHPSLYKGRSVLVSNTADHCKMILKTFLTEKLDDFTVNELDQIIESYPIVEGQAHKDGVYTALLALKHLESTQGLSQSLSGFNDALLMHKQTLQLAVADPIGFQDYQRFAQAVKKAVGKFNLVAPEPLNDFNPIRAGWLQIRELSVIDTFGQYVKLNLQNPLTSSKMRTSATQLLGQDFIKLPPRLTQPAHLRFRWLSAFYGDDEMNTHPATSPICGWVVPNNLDRSLMLYEHTGNMLGYFDREGNWQAAPGAVTKRIDQATFQDVTQLKALIPNDTLRNLIIHWQRKGAEYLKHLQEVLDDALENIQPESFEKHQDLVLLMGRPIAVVRCSLGINLKGLPAVHQGWTQFRLSMAKALKMQGMTTDQIERFIQQYRETYQFTKVDFPVKIGDDEKLNDGLLGYWEYNFAKYQATDAEQLTFYAPQADEDVKTDLPTKINIDKHQYVRQSIADPPKVITALFDPTGSLHATTGILPVKEINIPMNQYKAALQKIEVTFLTAPVLSQQDQWQVSFPKEKGYAWSWVEAQRFNGNLIWWESPMINRKTFAAQWAHSSLNLSGTNLWNELVAKKWITSGTLYSPFYNKNVQALTSVWTSGMNKILVGSMLKYLLQEKHFVPINKTQFIDNWIKLSKKAMLQEANLLWEELNQSTIQWIEPNVCMCPINHWPQKAFDPTGDWGGAVQTAIETMFKTLGAQSEAWIPIYWEVFQSKWQGHNPSISAEKAWKFLQAPEVAWLWIFNKRCTPIAHRKSMSLDAHWEAQKPEIEAVLASEPFIQGKAFKKADFIKAWLAHLQLIQSQPLWDELHRQAWLQATHQKDWAHVVRKDLRQHTKLSEDWKNDTDAIETILRNYSKRVKPFEQGVTFDGESVIREGWLKLSKLND